MPCYAFRCDTVPSLLIHPHTLIVPRKHPIPLMPVSTSAQSRKRYTSVGLQVVFPKYTLFEGPSSLMLVPWEFLGLLFSASWLTVEDLHPKPWTAMAWLIWEGCPQRIGIDDSNGIRFSITDLSRPTTRTMPSIFAERAAISLYDAQHPRHSKDKIAIPEETIAEVVQCMQRFKNICKEYGVPDENIHVVATEATRYFTLSETVLNRGRR